MDVESVFREKGGDVMGVAISGWDGCELVSSGGGEGGGKGGGEGEGVGMRGVAWAESEL